MPPTLTAAAVAPRLLLVDDEDGVRETLATVLTRQGYQVTGVASAAEALAILERDPFDVLVADMHLGAETGIEVTTAALQRDPDMATIVLTGYVSTEAAIEALRGGVGNFLAKPCNLDELKLAIERGLERRRLHLNLRSAEQQAAGRAEAERARLTAERFAQRLAAFQAGTAELAAAVSEEEVASLIVRTAIAALQASGAALGVLDAAGENLAVIAFDRIAVPREWRRSPLAASTPLSEAVRTGRPVLLESAAARGDRFPDSPHGFTETAGAWAFMPLLSGGHCLGVLALVFTEERAFSDEDRHFIELLSSQCAQALERARLYEVERQAREQAEAARHEAESVSDLLGEIFRQAPAMICLLSGPDHVFRMANDVWCQVVGRDRDQVIGKPFREVFPESDPSVSRLLDDVLASGRPWVGRDQRRMLDRGGSGTLTETYFDAVYQPIRIAGSEDSILVHGVEVTDKFQALREVERTAEQLRQIVDNLPQGLSVIDARGQVLLTNAAGLAIAGPPLNRGVEGYAEHGIWHMDGRPMPAAETPLARALRERQVFNAEQMIVRHSESGQRVPILVSAAPLISAGGELLGAVGVYENISDLKNLERQKDEFLSSAAHDLRTPVTAIRGLLQLLQRRAQRDGQLPLNETLNVLRDIEASTGRMSGLIDQLLDLARIDSNRALELQRRPLDLVALARQVIGYAQGLSGEHDIELQTSQPELWGDWDLSRLERALTNLLANAVKYSPRGGRVQVTIRSEAPASGPQEAVLSVRDWGIGIPPEEIAQVFERFSRGSNVPGQVPGTGIGLPYARQVILQHGGLLLVESTMGAGTTMTVRLPLAAPAAPGEPPDGEAHAAA